MKTERDVFQQKNRVFDEITVNKILDRLTNNIKIFYILYLNKQYSIRLINIFIIKYDYILNYL